MYPFSSPENSVTTAQTAVVSFNDAPLHHCDLEISIRSEQLEMNTESIDEWFKFHVFEFYYCNMEKTCLERVIPWRWRFSYYHYSSVAIFAFLYANHIVLLLLVIRDTAQRVARESIISRQLLSKTSSRRVSVIKPLCLIAENEMVS